MYTQLVRIKKSYNAMDFDFGISLDASAVAQRHTLYDSDEEEEEIGDVKTVLTITATSSPELDGATLLVAVGQTASIFARSCFILESEPIYLISGPDKVLQHPCAASRKAAGEKAAVTISEVFSAKRNVPGSPFLVCIHEKPLASEYCNIWCAKLFECLQPETVLILHSIPAYEHFATHARESDSGSFLCSLQSSSWQHPPTAPFLEPPNTVKGDAAAVLTHCQVKSMAASLAVLYTVTSQGGTECASAFQSVLKHPLVADSVCLKSEAEANQLLKKLIPKPRQDLSTLYT